jgi:hypothetical protein
MYGSNWKLQDCSLVKLRILSRCSSFVAYCWDFLVSFVRGLHLQSFSFLFSYAILQSSKWPIRKHLPHCHSPEVARETAVLLFVMTYFPTNVHDLWKCQWHISPVSLKECSQFCVLRTCCLCFWQTAQCISTTLQPQRKLSSNHYLTADLLKTFSHLI